MPSLGECIFCLVNYLLILRPRGFARAMFWKLAGAEIDKVTTCVIRKGAFIEYASQLTSGSHLQVGRGTYFCAHAPTVLGQHVTLSVNCMILTMHHEGNQHENEIYRPVSIGDGTIIYAGVTVLPGSCIPANSIIGAGQVVRRM